MQAALAALMTFGVIVFVTTQQMFQREGAHYGLKRLPGKTTPKRETTKVVVPGQDDSEIDLPDVGDGDPGTGGPQPGPAITPGSCLSRHSNIYARTPVKIDSSIKLPKLPAGMTVRLNMPASIQRQLVDTIEQLNGISPTVPSVQARRALDGLVDEECFMGDPQQLTPAESVLLLQAKFLADAVWIRDKKTPVQLGENENFVSRSQLGMPTIGVLNVEPDQVLELLVKGDDPFTEEHIFARAMYRFDQDTYMVEVLERDMLGEDVAPRLADLHGFDVGDQLMVADKDPTAVYRVYPQKAFSELDHVPLLAQNVALFAMPFANGGENAFEARIIDAGFTRAVMVITDSRSSGYNSIRTDVLQNAAMNPSSYYGIVDCAANPSLCSQVNAVYMNTYTPQGKRIDSRQYQNLQPNTVLTVINSFK